MPSASTKLELSEGYEDSLECGRKDCVDWFEVEVPARGALRIRVWEDSPSESLRLLDATLIDASGAVIARGVPVEGEAGASELGMNIRAEAGAYRFSVEVARPDVRQRIVYRLSPEFEREVRRRPAAVSTPPPPVRPRFSTVSVPVLEVESLRGANPSLLLGAGATGKLERCLQGKLVEGGKTLGEIEIIEVFPSGSRARIVGTLRGEITSQTQVELSIPLNSAARPKCR